MKLVVSDAHEGLKAAVTKVLSATWQRCRVHFMRNVLAHAGKSGRRVVSAFIATAFAQDTADAASAQWRSVADQIRPKVPKLATIMDNAQEDVLAYMTFPKEHRAKLHSTDEIDKSFAQKYGSFPCADDLVVKCAASAESTIRPPYSSLAGLRRPRAFPSGGRGRHLSTKRS